jgi:Acetyltransferase (GNAT) domain
MACRTAAARIVVVRAMVRLTANVRTARAHLLGSAKSALFRGERQLEHMGQLACVSAADSIPGSETMIYCIDPIKDPRWAPFVQQHASASVFHSAGWLKALRSTYSYEPLAYTTSAPGQELQNGLLFCLVDSYLTGRRLVSLPFTDHCNPLFDSTENLTSVLRFLEATVKQQNLKYLELRPTSGDFENNSFLPTAKFFLHTLSLIPALTELFQEFDKNCVQRRVQRADRAGLVERHGRSEELLKDFFTLFALTRGRLHLPFTPINWFRNLIRYLEDAVTIRVAYKDDTPIAAVLTLGFKGTVYYKYGCSDARFNKFGAMPWLLWRTIVEAKTNGAVAFDLGRTEADNLGLLAFKNHFVPQPESLTYWRYPDGSSLDSLYGWKLKVAKRVFSCFPNSFLKIIGRSTYRHIG